MSNSQQVRDAPPAPAASPASAIPPIPAASPATTALPVTTTTRTQDIMLLEFLRQHDAAPPDCPVCGYSLKALTRPICPECGQQLVLTVGTGRLRLGWLFAAVAPGFFSGIAAVFTLVPIVGRVLFGDGVWTVPLIALDLFGWCSAVFAIILAAKSRRFIAQPRARQVWWALLIWLAHLAALGLFILLGIALF